MSSVSKPVITVPRVWAHPQTIAFTVFVIAVVLYPLVFPGRFPLGAGIAVGTMAIASVGFVLLVGHAQQLALGQAVFCMIGGYGNAILCTRYGWDPTVALLASMVMSMAVAWVIGFPILRLRGFYLAMASLGFQMLLMYGAVEMVGLTGGALGTTGIPKFALFGLPLGSDLQLYAVSWVTVSVAVIMGLNLDRSQVGRSLRAVAGSELAASAMGIDVTRQKAQMFVLSAGFASVCGSLTVHYLRVMEPYVFDLQYGLAIITAVIVGGLGSIWGGVLGASLIVALREALRSLGVPLWEVIILGAMTIVVLIAFRAGIAGAIEGLWSRRGFISGPSAPAVTSLRPQGVVKAEASRAEDARGPILAVQGLCRSFGSLAAVSDVSFAVQENSITAVIGPNGAGKTTVFNIISGYLAADRGSIAYRGQSIEKLEAHQIAQLGLSRTFQHLQIFDSMSVIENVMCGGQRVAPVKLWQALLQTPGARRREAETRAGARYWLAFVGLADMADVRPHALSFGHQRLLEIARALAAEPDLLIMDEPASGLNDTETEELANLILRIQDTGKTILLVEHDIRLVMGISEYVVVMDHGVVLAAGLPDVVRQDPAVITAYLGRS